MGGQEGAASRELIGLQFYNQREGGEGERPLPSSFFFFNYLFTFWLRWAFVAVPGLSPGVGLGATLCRGARAAHCSGFSHRLESAGSVVGLQGLRCPAACRSFPDQGLNLCPLHWQANSLPLSQRGSPNLSFKVFRFP